MAKKKKSVNVSKGYRERSVGTRELIQRFLIVCEGEKTEPNYFENFRVPKIVCVVKGFGNSTTKLVEDALREKKKDDYDQVWCVFDRDESTIENFNDALRLAAANHIQVAYSNQSFELWYLLHFHYYDTSIPRHEYIKKLGNLLGHYYKKNDKNIYRELESRQDDAIRNAERLLNSHQPLDPARNDPSTTVHLLVKELNRFIR